MLTGNFLISVWISQSHKWPLELSLFFTFSFSFLFSPSLFYSCLLACQGLVNSSVSARHVRHGTHLLSFFSLLTVKHITVLLFILQIIIKGLIPAHLLCCELQRSLDLIRFHHKHSALGALLCRSPEYPIHLIFFYTHNTKATSGPLTQYNHSLLSLTLIWNIRQEFFFSMFYLIFFLNIFSKGFKKLTYKFRLQIF